jgi:O-antigen/teichoic acid export membrane protein
MKIPLTTRIRLKDYKSLLTESLPQIGVAFLAAGIARIDWILLGLFSTPEAIAEYSFAYRVYEISPLPLLIIAPILLARFSRFYANKPDRSVNDKKTELSMLVRAEMIAATFIPLLLNVIWTPAIDSLTADKYGAVNWHIFLILSFCVPFGYIINILWSALFAQDRLKLILKITAITFCIILIGDLIFIPIWGGLGAAFVFLVATVVEYINFMRFSELSKIKETWLSLFICMAIAMGSGIASIYFFDDLILRLATALILFIVLLLATRQLRKDDLALMFSFVKKRNINF